MPALSRAAAGNGLEAFGLSLMTIAAAVSNGVCKWSPLVVRVLIGRDKLFQSRAVIGWEDGEEDGRPGRRSPTLTSQHDAGDGGADQLR